MNDLGGLICSIFAFLSSPCPPPSPEPAGQQVFSWHWVKEGSSLRKLPLRTLSVAGDRAGGPIMAEQHGLVFCRLRDGCTLHKDAQTPTGSHPCAQVAVSSRLGPQVSSDGMSDRSRTRPYPLPNTNPSPPPTPPRADGHQSPLQLCLFFLHHN